LECFSKADQRPNTTFFWPPALSAAALGHLDQIDRAHEFLIEARRREPTLSADTIRNTIGRYGLNSGTDQIIDGLRKAGMPE
jgi:hypothetical protein